MTEEEIKQKADAIAQAAAEVQKITSEDLAFTFNCTDVMPQQQPASSTNNQAKVTEIFKRLLEACEMVIEAADEDECASDDEIVDAIDWEFLRDVAEDATHFITKNPCLTSALPGGEQKNKMLLSAIDDHMDVCHGILSRVMSPPKQGYLADGGLVQLEQDISSVVDRLRAEK